MSTDKKENCEFLRYKDKPLVRCKNILYYGELSDEYVIMLQILETKKVDDIDVATKVHVELQLTDPDVKARDRVVKTSDKPGLYDALDIGAIWLDRALKK